jgi:competence protein ComEA
MNRHVKDFLSFNKIERTGLISLMLIVLLLILLYSGIDKYNSLNPYDFTEFQTEIDSFLAARSDVISSRNRQFSNQNFQKSDVKYFYFNPNGLEEHKWKELGLSEKQIKTIKNFESKGGRFYKKSDLSKMYCISNEDYKRLEPWIILEEKYESKAYQSNFHTVGEALVELNTADSSVLVRLKGVGPYTASNIIKYREKLGGFSRVEQLSEVYRMSPETYEAVKSKVFADTSIIVPGLKINSSDFYTLLKHPYIDKPLAYNITAYRQRYGKLKSHEDFLKIEGVCDSLLHLLRPYLCFE